jgi:hypothetical protein
MNPTATSALLRFALEVVERARARLSALAELPGADDPELGRLLRRAAGAKAFQSLWIEGLHRQFAGEGLLEPLSPEARAQVDRVALQVERALAAFFEWAAREARPHELVEALQRIGRGEEEIYLELRGWMSARWADRVGIR